MEGKRQREEAKREERKARVSEQGDRDRDIPSAWALSSICSSLNTLQHQVPQPSSPQSRVLIATVA